MAEVKVTNLTMKPATDHTEARAFERSAARGVRDVGMAWVLRKLVLPLGLVLLLVVVAVFHSNGFWAAIPAAAVLVGYVVWVGAFYRRNFLNAAPFQRLRSTKRIEQ